jgi:hypothetical protein
MVILLKLHFCGKVKGTLILYNIHTYIYIHIQGVPGGKDNILGGRSIGHSKQKTLFEHVSYSERFPR